MTVGLISQIKSRRRKMGMSIAELSRRSGVPRPNISRIERGLADPRLSTVERILAALDLTCRLIPQSPVGLAAVLERAERGKRTLSAAGISSSDPWRRLGRRAARGDDVAAEARVLAETERRGP
jgi:transcriptional regulator with XRE-family HTH domain